MKPSTPRASRPSRPSTPAPRAATSPAHGEARAALRRGDVLDAARRAFELRPAATVAVVLGPGLEARAPVGHERAGPYRVDALDLADALDLVRELSPRALDMVRAAPPVEAVRAVYLDARGALVASWPSRLVVRLEARAINTRGGAA